MITRPAENNVIIVQIIVIEKGFTGTVSAMLADQGGFASIFVMGTDKIGRDGGRNGEPKLLIKMCLRIHRFMVAAIERIRVCLFPNGVRVLKDTKRDNIGTGSAPSGWGMDAFGCKIRNRERVCTEEEPEEEAANFSMRANGNWN